MKPLLRAVLAGTALLAAAAAAPARAPSASDRGSMDWLLRSLQADREVDARGPAVDPLVAKVDAYAKGDPSAPFDEWTPVADAVKDPRAKFGLRDRAVNALLERVRLELDRRTDPRTVNRVKTEICKHVLKMVLADDLESRTLVKRVLDGLMPGLGVDWKADDSLQKRSKAFQDLQKKLR